MDQTDIYVLPLPDTITTRIDFNTDIYSGPNTVTDYIRDHRPDWARYIFIPSYYAVGRFRHPIKKDFVVYVKTAASLEAWFQEHKRTLEQVDSISGILLDTETNTDRFVLIQKTTKTQTT